MIERSFVFIKPDGVERGLSGDIISRFEKVGLTIVGMKMVWVDRDFAKKHYIEHVEKAFYPPNEDYVTSGPVLAMVLEGVGAISLIRKMVGGTEPHSALPGTIRGDLSHISYSYADGTGKGISVRNIIHASSDSDDAKREIELWFKDEELYSYDIVHNKHLRK